MSAINGTINCEFSSSASLTDIDIISDESFIDHNINNLTIKELIEGHTLPCCSYTKHWSKSSNGQPTGYVLLTNETANLSIINIYMLITSTDMINKDMLTNDLLNRGVIIDGNTYTNYCDKGINRFISWRNFKIKKKKIMKMNKFFSL